MITIVIVYVCLAGQNRQECMTGYLEKKPLAPCSTAKQCRDQETAYADKHWGNQGTYLIFATEDVPVDHE
jgi:hypothetical protein